MILAMWCIACCCIGVSGCDISAYLPCSVRMGDVLTCDTLPLPAVWHEGATQASALQARSVQGDVSVKNVFALRLPAAHTPYTLPSRCL